MKSHILDTNYKLASIETKGIKGIKKLHSGKVRDVYSVGEKTLLIETSDRVSAFDEVIGSVKEKGKLLNTISTYWFETTQHLVPNHYLFSVGNSMFVRRTTPFKLEVIVRSYITGSLWKLYEQKGAEYVNHLFGITLPKGLHKNEKLQNPILTPTSKDSEDLPIHWKDFTDINNDNYLLSLKEWDTIKNYALTLFQCGVEKFEKQNIIMVDTKYEFGKDSDENILLIDELHTCDSSRFWDLDSYLKNPKNVTCFDKQFFRNWLLEVGYKKNTPITIPKNISTQLIELYDFILKKLDYKNPYSAEFGDLSREDLATCFFNYFSQETVFIWAGSKSDASWVEQVDKEIHKLGYDTFIIYGSAHKETEKVIHELKAIHQFSQKRRILFVTIAGRSNALSGVITCNTHYPVIACPPFKDKLDMMVNIHSTLQMPSNVAVMTILEPVNVAINIDKIFSM